MAHLPLGMVFNEEDFSGAFAGHLLLRLCLTWHDTHWYPVIKWLVFGLRDKNVLSMASGILLLHLVVCFVD